ncbi:MAG: hypothetical protein IRY97_04245, partial [Thermomicrobiaceae bacterium]|nr:hypothetical protein [Thermomicrobiaceae bacterium]
MDEQTPMVSPEEREQAEGEAERRRAESWREMAEQLQEFVSRVATAFRTAWAEERPAEPEAETVRGLADNLRASADRLERVLRRVAAETEPQREAALGRTREASERAMEEARATAIAALRSLN